MPREKVIPQPFAEGPRPAIQLVPVGSGQVSAVGYDAATKTLAVTFHRGNAVYHYPNVEPDTHQAFVNAESIGSYFGQNIKNLPFEKFPSPDEVKSGD